MGKHGGKQGQKPVNQTGNPVRRRGPHFQKVPQSQKHSDSSDKPRGRRNRSEKATEAALKKLRLRFEYEPREFKLEPQKSGAELTGKTTRGFRPDYYLLDLDLYLEVTEARFERTLERKRAKIARVWHDYHVRVILIGPEELAELAEHGVRYLRQVIGAVGNADDFKPEPVRQKRRQSRLALAI